MLVHVHSYDHVFAFSGDAEINEIPKRADAVIAVKGFIRKTRE